MRVIYMLKGLPASGKSTYAKDMISTGKIKRISKDDLRSMLHNGKYTPELEMFILDARNILIKLALKQGFDVVIDDTNLNPIHQEAIHSLAKVFEAAVEEISFDTPVEECIRRDALRDHPVGKEVILGMHNRYFGGTNVSN